MVMFPRKASERGESAADQPSESLWAEPRREPVPVRIRRRLLRGEQALCPYHATEKCSRWRDRKRASGSLVRAARWQTRRARIASALTD